MTSRWASELRPWELPGGVAYYQPLGAPSGVDAMQNMMDGLLGINTATPGVAPTWTPWAGWGFNGTTQYLNTSIIPNSGSWSMLVCFSNTTIAHTAHRCMVGAFASTGTKRFYLFCDNVAGNSHEYGIGTGGVDNGYYRVTPALTEGVMGIAGPLPYLNGIADGVASTSNAGCTAPIYIGAMRVDTSVSYFLLGFIKSVTICSRPLTAAEMWLASMQMAHCDLPEYNVWAPKQIWSIPITTTTPTRARILDSGLLRTS